MNLDYNFAIFILSHNRANKIETLQMIQKYNYSGKWFIVISTDDSQLCDYKKFIPSDNLLIFNKSETLRYTDLLTNKFVNNASIYAINYARQHNIDYFIEADDDIQKIYHRFEENGKMKQKEISNLDDVINPLIDFISMAENIKSINPAINSGFFGGVNGVFKKGLDHYSFQFMLCKKSIPFFRGIRTEDRQQSHYYTTRTSELFLTFFGLSFESPQMASNSGGIQYMKDGNVNPYTYILLTSPSCIRLKEGNKKIIYKNKAFPKIISCKFKK